MPKEIITSFEQRVLNRLEPLTARFLDIRNTLGVGPELGFASLPTANDGLIGIVIPLRKQMEELHYSALFLWGYVDQVLDPKEEGRILLPPDYSNEKSSVVSIYPETLYEKETKKHSFFSIPLEIVEGVIAHEVAHWRALYPDPLPKAIKRQMRLMGRHPDKKIEAEAKIDLLASSFGFRDQILQFLNFLYEDASGNLSKSEQHKLDAYDIESLEMEIAEIGYRKSQVLAYS